ncbi:MAG: JAB domain-containing protein [Balneola sp.]
MPLIAEVSLAYKSSIPVNTLPIITNPEKANAYLRSIWDMDTIELREEFVVVLLNNGKRVLGWSRISIGGSTATIVEPSTVFQVALLGKAQSIIIAHCHPSGVLKASQADIALTKRLKDIGKLLSIPVEDHIILTKDGFVSLQMEGHM